MIHIVAPDEGLGRAILTDEHAQSNYGIPVLVIESPDASAAFGPADTIGDSGIPAATVVFEWAKNPARTPQERQAANSFLRQWPAGPQLEAE
jgi:hypothetical protein